MNFFRRLDATFSGELLAAQAETTSRHAQTDLRTEDYTLITGPTREGKVGKPEFELAPEHPEIWAAFTAIGNSDGVIDHTTAAQFLPANPQENP